MRILFWNTQRLGDGTSGDKAVLAEGVLAAAFNDGADLAVLCEVTSSTTLGDAEIDKTLMVARRGRKQQSQLGYATLTPEYSQVDCSSFQPPPFEEVFRFSAYRKGGSAFVKHTKRHVACLESVGDVDVYVYHANASAKAAYLVAWVLEALRQIGRRFVLFGDLNCEPADLVGYIQYNHTHGTNVGSQNDFTIAFGAATHNAKKGATKVYDYAIGGNKTAVTVTAMNTSGVMSQDAMSDHLPIFVAFS